MEGAVQDSGDKAMEGAVQDSGDKAMEGAVQDSGDKAMEGAVQVCRNCKRSVASAHLTLHEAHCMLFLVLCPECKEPVPQAKMEEHCETGHQQVGCAMCQQTMQKHLLEFHETTECQERPTDCKFCGVVVRLGKLKIHEHHCGSRTELCLDCGQFVVVRGLAQHKDACGREQAQPQRGKRISAPKNKISHRDCNRMTPGNKYLHHLDKCRTVSESTKYLPIGEPTISPPSLPSQAAEDQTSTAKRDVRPKTKNINRFPLFSETSTKQAPSDTKPQITSPVEDEAAYDILRRCAQCDILLPLPTLNQHQEKCWWLASLNGKQVRNFS
ncbi:XIAP-associated factor 1 isoform X1 [Phyllostomus hastatus]|uniref:XIAP-associated factor 1 isoform X1 n=2 Tax=Phyllostomus hastatus TaxID=9423 RepID=UPI001E684733|nr:XIAP-associated factor 1 isoform X1 [Phyllostomus hastatus]